mgnify:CR=1 FL=1
MDFETMKYYVSTGLWPQERIEKLFKKKRITQGQYDELMGLVPQ